MSTPCVKTPHKSLARGFDTCTMTVVNLQKFQDHSLNASRSSCSFSGVPKVDRRLLAAPCAHPRPRGKWLRALPITRACRGRASAHATPALAHLPMRAVRRAQVGMVGGTLFALASWRHFGPFRTLFGPLDTHVSLPLGHPRTPYFTPDGRTLFSACGTSYYVRLKPSNPWRLGMTGALPSLPAAYHCPHAARASGVRAL